MRSGAEVLGGHECWGETVQLNSTDQAQSLLLTGPGCRGRTQPRLLYPSPSPPLGGQRTPPLLVGAARSFLDPESVPRSAVKAAHPSFPAPPLGLYSGPGSAPRLPCLTPALVAASYFWSVRKLQGGGSTVHGASVDLGGAASWRLCPWSWGGRVSGIRGASHCSGGEWGACWS